MRLLTALTAVSAALCIAAALGLITPWLAFVFKPLTTVLVIAYAWPGVVPARAPPLPLSALWILATYWLAQWCIASALKRAATSP